MIAPIAPQLLAAISSSRARKPYVNWRRREQLQQLLAAGAISRETAVCTSMHYKWSSGVLSRMIDEGFVAHAQLPYKGDSKRRLSHYWLTDAGMAAAA